MKVRIFACSCVTLRALAVQNVKLRIFPESSVTLEFKCETADSSGSNVKLRGLSRSSETLHKVVGQNVKLRKFTRSCVTPRTLAVQTVKLRFFTYSCASLKTLAGIKYVDAFLRNSAYSSG